MKNILITGAAGYIGTNLQHYLVPFGFNVIKIDKQYNTYTENIFEYNLNNIDLIIHLSAVSGIQDCENDKPQATMDNIYATNILVEYAKLHGIPIIFASSQAADNSGSSYYATSKYISEQTLFNMNYEYEAKNIVLRFSNVYGGYKYFNTKNSVVSKFYNDIKNNQKITVNGEGNQKRDFIHVTDICYFIYKCICYIYDEGTRYDTMYTQPVNVCTGSSLSINELSEYFKLYSNKEFEIEHKTISEVGLESNTPESSHCIKSWMGSSILTKHKDLKKYIKSIYN